MVLAGEAMRSNIQVMAGWCRERGLEIIPHGRTTMAPTLWRRQVAAGALGIRLATTGLAAHPGHLAVGPAGRTIAHALNPQRRHEDP